MGRHHPLRASFGFAWEGLVEGAVRDRNLRIHLGLGVLVGAFAALAPLTPAERAVLLACAAAVIAAEAANSALEVAVDLASPGPDERARLAKDSAAAAVLAVAAGSVLAFLAVAVPRAAELVARVRVLGDARAGGLAAAAALCALAAASLPSPRIRPVATDVAWTISGAIGLLVLVPAAESVAGLAAAGLCLAVGAGAAVRRRRGAHHSG